MKSKWITHPDESRTLRIADSVGFTVELSRDEVQLLLSDLCHNVYPTPKHPNPEAATQRCCLCE